MKMGRSFSHPQTYSKCGCVLYQGIYFLWEMGLLTLEGLCLSGFTQPLRGLGDVFEISILGVAFAVSGL